MQRSAGSARVTAMVPRISRSKLCEASRTRVPSWARPKVDGMATTQRDIGEMVKSLPLGKGHEAQERAVAATLDAFLVRGQRGVVLADEVGFGKTYEALAV